MSEDSPAACPCTGIRFCAHCIDSERVQSLLNNKVPLKRAEEVIANQSEKERTSSCSFAMIEKSQLAYCAKCERVFECRQLLRRCEDHAGFTVSPVVLPGLKVFSDGISAEEEAAIVKALDNPAPFPAWTVSQSGRRLQEYGPKKNFKKKKAKLPEVVGMPAAFKPVVDLISARTEAMTGVPYVVAEASVLEYTKKNLSNFDPHVDDTWLWGDRIVGLNLLEDSAITFVSSSGDCIDVFLPHRGYFMMSGACRHQWMHGIRPENIKERRISVTFRELSPTILEDDCTTEMLLTAARTYL